MSHTGDKSNGRILVAEDDEAIRMYLELVLAQLGYTLVMAEDGEEAVRKFREHGPFDLAILDIHMPRLDGRGALEKIRALQPGVRGLVLSGMPMEGDGSMPEWARGFDGFLSKPFDPAGLVQAVQRVLSGKQGAA